MENDNLNKLWDAQKEYSLDLNPKAIISKAKKQRTGQFISISVMSFTVVLLTVYTFYHAFYQWNSFNLGLVLMISSLSFRIILEMVSLYRKEKQLISMAQNYYHNYLKRYYKIRLIINYAITPVCIVIYILGFFLLLPYFKIYFSEGFYTYILISGMLSITVVIAIIVVSIRKEQRFLKLLNAR